MNPMRSGLLRPAVFVSGRENEKLCKKVLTSAGKHDIITKLSDADGARQKGFEKTGKKVLTKLLSCGKINKLSREDGKEP